MKKSYFLFLLCFFMVACTSIDIKSNEVKRLDKGTKYLVAAGFFPPEIALYVETKLRDEMRKCDVNAIIFHDIADKHWYVGQDQGPSFSAEIVANHKNIIAIGFPPMGVVQDYTPVYIENHGGVQVVNALYNLKSTQERSGYYVSNPNYKLDIKYFDFMKSPIPYLLKIYSNYDGKPEGRDFMERAVPKIVRSLFSCA